LVATWKYFLLGGVIDDLAPDEMAFVHRGYAMLTSIELEWLPTDSAEVVAENKRWLHAFHDEMEQYTSAYCYQNFIDPSQENYLHAYYGANLPRLQDVKRTYDPGNVFHYPQSIPL
jgi:FAD/FMN-containing dehydrogenase